MVGVLVHIYILHHLILRVGLQDQVWRRRLGWIEAAVVPEVPLQARRRRNEMMIRYTRHEASTASTVLLAHIDFSQPCTYAAHRIHSKLFTLGGMGIA